MDCTCGAESKYKTRYYNVRKKYEQARRHHKKLLGVAMELTQVLEEYVRGDRIPNVTETMLLCANIYPSLFHELNARTKEIEMETVEAKAPEEPAPEKIEEKAEENGEDEMEYSEGFMSRPKLPRTPQNGQN